MNRYEFDTEINDLLFLAEKIIPDDHLQDLPFMELAPTVHDWYDFECKLWEIGENIRQMILSERKNLNAEQIDRVYKICGNTKAKRGRQSFVMLLGKKRFLPYADLMAGILPDNDIDGHIINTLYKMGASQYVEKITPYTNHTITWVRNEAKRYIRKYGA